LYRAIDALVAAKQCGTFLMFTSAHQGEGKTTVCSSFAAVLAQYFGKSVLILDGDRNHVLSRRFGAPEEDSIEMLSNSPEAVLQAAKTVGARGSIAAVPVASLVGMSSADSPELELLESVKPKLATTFDYVLLDAPSVADVSWSPRVGRIADGVILVIEAERTRWPVVMNTKQEFENSGAKVIGAFLNKRKFYIPARVYRFL
jgi:protein-tyrosine kinase